MPDTFGAHPVIEINGKSFTSNVRPLHVYTRVESDANGPDYCRVVLHDPEYKVLGEIGAEHAAKIKVSAERIGETTPVKVFTGVIYNIGFEYERRAPHVTITGYDHSYGLYNGLHTKTYKDMLDSEVAEAIAAELGLDSVVHPTPVQHVQLSQMNETHWHFLSRRARELGYLLRVDGETLEFVERPKAADAPAPGDHKSRERLALVTGKNVRQISARVTGVGQVTEIEVRGWDPKVKEPLVATTTPETLSVDTSDKPVDIAKLFGGASKRVTVDLPLSTQAECEAVAAAQAERVAGAAMHAEGVAEGDPKIMAGAAVSLGSTPGRRFDGKYVVTKARHVWDDRGYRTELVVSGDHDRSVLGLTSGHSAAQQSAQINGVVTAIVTNISDDEKQGRVKLRFPWLSDDYESDWARVVQIGAGSQRGLHLLPEVNDEVLVVFERGDTRRPYVLGGLYNGKDNPALEEAVNADSGELEKRGLRTRAGHQLVFSDKLGEERIELATVGQKVTLLLDADGKKLTVRSTGDVEVVAEGNATVKAGKDAKVSADGSITVKAKKNLTLEAGGDVVIKGRTIKLN